VFVICVEDENTIWPIISKSDEAQIMSMYSIHDNVADVCGIKTTICIVIWQRDAFGGK